MLKEPKKGVVFLVIEISKAYRNIYILNRLLNLIGIRPYLNRFREWSLRKINETYFESNIDGIRIKMIDGSEAMEYFYLAVRGRTYEPVVIRYLKTLLSEFDNPTFVDIGAHYGYFTIYTGNLINSRGLVISIEPNKKFYQGIKKNIELNGLEKTVRVYHVALSNHHGKVQKSGLNEKAFYETENGETDAVTFDQLCEQEKIHPHIVKIDVHGAEGKILQGMSHMLENYVLHLFCEIHTKGDMRGFRLTDIIRMLDASGMEAFELVDHRKESGGELVRIDDGAYKVKSTDEEHGWMLYARKKININRFITTIDEMKC